MSDKSGAHVGNSFYTLGTMQPGIEDTPEGPSSAFFRMRRAERAINAAVRAAASPKIVAFPIRRAFRGRARASASPAWNCGDGKHLSGD